MSTNLRYFSGKAHEGVWKKGEKRGNGEDECSPVVSPNVAKVLLPEAGMPLR